ncbi:MAG TPA: M10 family metallopeptidase [Aestuariivirgaceae bacterium]|nr:M10 family metallopeptidase [Aestuariivirgaceae bacterium]
MPALATYSLTGDPYIDGLLGDAKWAVTDFTYSVPGSASNYGSNYGNGEPQDNFAALNSTQKSVVDTTLAMYASVTNLTFSKMAETGTNHADLRFAMSDKPSTAWAYFPSTAPEGGDAWFNNSSEYYDKPVKGNYAYSTFLHETGHALGLEHPHTDNVMPVDRDSLEYSVMSYRSYVGKSLNSGYTNETYGYPQSLMMYDIAALQHLYGANYETNGGKTTYSWSPTTGEMFINGVGQGAPGGNRIFLTVWDGGGTDTYDFSNYSTDLKVDLRPGQWTTTSAEQLAKLHYDGSEVAIGNIANALLFNGDQRSLIENAKGGSGDDVIRGNQADNKLWGGRGDDVLIGGDGDDILRGGSGDDVLIGGPGNDRLIGGPGSDVLRGGSGDDILAGGPGNDRLIGGPGIDVLRGGSGDDVLNGGPGNDRLIGGAGADVLRGGGGNDVLIGGKENDRLFGGPGDDRLVGGPGANVLVGGDGADTFVFRSANHSSPAATDTIRDFVSGVDTIDLRAIDADVTMAGNQAFSFIGSKPFSHNAGELTFRNDSLLGDTNGDGKADLQIDFLGVSKLTDSDFLL